MRKITQQVASSFNDNTGALNVGNTKVTHYALFTHNNIDFYDARVMTLHGNVIAVFNSTNGLYITNAGWRTNVTKDRLNAIRNVAIVQKQGKWFLNGNEWNGEFTKIN